MTPGQQLVEAAENLLKLGGSVKRREALWQAVRALPPAELEQQNITRQWTFTPPALGVLARAASLAQGERDQYIRIKHIEQAIRDTQ